METKKTLVLGTDEQSLTRAADIVRQGGTVVFPTETVYGLGANALDPLACKKIFEAKGRPMDNPLIVHVPAVFDIGRCAELSPEGAALAHAFMPGPLTLILPKKPPIPPEVTAGLPTVGLRVPASPAARDFLQKAGVPVAAPSANLSGRPSPTSFAMAWEAMSGRVDAIIQGEDSSVGLESTIVRISGTGAEILRPGGISAEELISVLGSIPLRAAFCAPAGTRCPPPAPGMKYTHYKPRAEVLLYKDAQELQKALTRCSGKKTGVIALGPETAPGPEQTGRGTIIFHRAASLREYAQRLYADFFVFDSLGCELILAHYPLKEGIGEAIRNRLQKASGGRFTEDIG